MGELRIGRSDVGVFSVGPAGSGAVPGVPDSYVSAALYAYDAGNLDALAGLPVDFGTAATSFRLEVWQELRRVGGGETISYAELARRVGRSSRASRAIGQAVGANPVPVIVPCHRVVAADGTLGGFGLGLDMKRRLLTHEGHGGLPGGRGSNRDSRRPHGSDDIRQ